MSALATKDGRDGWPVATVMMPTASGSLHHWHCGNNQLNFFSTDHAQWILGDFVRPCIWPAGRKP